MAVYKLFPSQDASIYSAFPAMNTGLDPILLRKYEKDRLKYFFAVITCDTARTADAIFNSCDG